MHLDTHITEKCNLNCHHCYLGGRSGKNMDIEMFKDIVDDYKETIIKPKKDFKENILLSGGEPTLHPKFPKFANYIHKKKLRLTIASNGYNVPKYIKYFNKEHDSIQISIDGDKFMHDWLRGEGSFDIAIKALKVAKENNINTSIMMTLHAGNQYYVSDVIDIARKYNSMLAINYFHDINDKNMLKQLLKERFQEIREMVIKEFDKRKHEKCYFKNCVAGIKVIGVRPNGEYWDCTRHQKVIGKYPQPLKEVFDLERAKNNNYKKPCDTCMKGENFCE